VITAVDTNALLALLYEDEHADRSEAELRRVYQEGRVVIAPIVYAELAADGQRDERGASGQTMRPDGRVARVPEVREREVSQR